MTTSTQPSAATAVRQQTPVAIVGLSALLPGSADVGAAWRNILSGKDLLTEIPDGHWRISDYYDADPKAPDKTYARRGGFLPTVDFDPLAFGVPPSIVPATDTSQLLALMVAEQCLQDAMGGDLSGLDRERVSTLMGVTSAQELLGSMNSRLQRPIWVKAMREAGLPEAEVQDICERISAHYVPWQESTFPGLLGNVVAGRIANRFDLRGTNTVTDAACASSLAALSMGVNELVLGQADLVLGGGVDTMNDIFMYMCFSKTPALSASGDCRPFSDQADGTMLGEGLVMFALMRLEDAEAQGRKVYAVLRGVGSSSDGRAKSVYAPLPEGQARALRRAYEIAGYGPETVELIEAHGTGTKAGDAAEFAGLRMVFGAEREDAQWCALGSIKSQIGHAKSAAGAAGLLKAVLALHHKVLPPTAKIDRPNPKLSVDESPFYLNTQARPWIRDGSHPRRAGVSAFGFGGSNFHMTLEEYQGGTAQPAKLPTTPTELWLFTGASGAAVLAAAQQAAAETATAHDLVWARAAALSRRAADATQPARLAVVAADAADLAAQLQGAAAAIQAGTAVSTPKGLRFAQGASAGDVAFLFPGQGSQYVGMGADLAMTYDVARAVWDRVAGARYEGRGVHQLAFPPPAFSDEERAAQQRALTATEWAQPAIGTASAALLAALRGLGVRPTAVGGHSYGELTALHAAGVFDADAHLEVSRKRGELMRDAAAKPGAMTVVSADADRVRELLAEWGLDVVLANHNHPTQAVLSGPTDAVAEAESRLRAAKLRFKRLGVATAFHSSVVSDSCAPFATFLNGVDFSPAAVPVYANSAAAPYAADADAMRATLSGQIAQPVRFVEQIEAMYAAGARTFVEVGPGAVLSGLVGKILGARPHEAVTLDRKGKHGVTSLQRGLGHLASLGVALDFDGLEGPLAAAPAAKKKPKMTLQINGTNYGKPYPAPNAVIPAPNPARQPEVVVEKVVEVREVHVEVPVAAPASAASEGQATAHGAPQPQANHAPTNLAWITAYQELQQQTAAAHSAYQRATAETHSAFLRTAEASLTTLGALLTGEESAAHQGSALPALTTPAAAPWAQAAPAVAAVPAAAAPVAAAPVAAAPVAAVPVAAVPVAAAPVAAVPFPAQVAPPSAPPSAAPAGVDLEALLLEVVADKTGYPAEMLGMEMELEADLGVDSIKRVEILSAVREQAPGLGEVDPAALANLDTLAAIVSYLRAQQGDLAPATAAKPSAAQSAPATAGLVAAPVGVDLEALLLAVVADKTGYPAEMLGMEMELEADLGVDSIKRVEILSAVREQAPGLGEVDPAALASLDTLAAIVSYLRAQQGDEAPAGTAAAPTTEAGAEGGAPGVDLEALLLAVVADKTGYPAEMLGMEMELEADLGIDSIKRVEILSAMREQAPSLGEVDPAAIAGLDTLGAIVAHLRGADDPEPDPAGGGPSGGGGGHGGADSSERGAGGTTDSSSSGAATASAANPDVGAQAAGGVRRYAVRAVAATAPGVAVVGLRTAKRAVITPATELGRALQAALQRAGVGSEVTDEVPADADAVLAVGALEPLADRDAALAVNLDLFRLVRGLAARFSATGGLLVTTQDTGGDFGLAGAPGVQAWTAGVAALARTAANEWPAATVRALDVARGDDDVGRVAARIAAELLLGGSAREIGLGADGSRWRPAPVALAQDGEAADLGATDVIVASGGARGVTAASLVTLAQQTQARMVLLGRTALADEPAATRGVADEAGLKRALLTAAKASGTLPSPAALGREVGAILRNREVRATLASLELSGSEARYVAVDVTDAAALSAALATVRADWGPITGLVHGAGVLADKLLVDKTEAQFQRVFNTKAVGLAALLDATAGDPVRAVGLFSSVAARAGNPGQADYAMANEVLNAVACAAWRQRPEAAVSAIGWGPWEGGMVTPQLKAHFEAQGVALVPVDVGARHFAAALTHRSEDACLLVAGRVDQDALRAGADQVWQTEVHVSPSTFPEVGDHRIAGNAVLPVALASELLLRAAEDAAGGPVAGLRQVKVLRGVQLPTFGATGEPGEGDTLLLRATRREGSDVLRLELCDLAGRPHYRAEALTAVNGGMTPLAAPGDLAPWTTRDALYDGHVLFHGPRFQVLRQVSGVSASGLAATAEGASDRGWPTAGLRSDPALFDAAMQAAVLWAETRLGGATLPMAVGALELGVPGAAPANTPVSVTVRADKVAAASATCTVQLSAEGVVLASLSGVELVLRPAAPAGTETAAATVAS